MSLVHTELDKLGKELEKKMKEYALPNKKTGRLDKSIKYDTYSVGKERFKLEIYTMYYGKYLNGRTGFFNRAYKEVILDKGIRDIITYASREIYEDILEMDW